MNIHETSGAADPLQPKAPDQRFSVNISADPNLLARAMRAETENAFLRAAIGEAYGYLWCVNNEPGTPNRYPSEKAAYEARKVLRETMTKEERGRYINDVMPRVVQGNLVQAVSDLVKRDAHRFRKLLMKDKHWLGVFTCDPDGTPCDSLDEPELIARLDAINDL